MLFECGHLAIKQKIRRQHLVKSLANFISFLRFPAAQNVRGQKGLRTQMVGGKGMGCMRWEHGTAWKSLLAIMLPLTQLKLLLFQSLFGFFFRNFRNLQLATGNRQLATTAITHKLLLLLLLALLFAISFRPVLLAQLLTKFLQHSIVNFIILNHLPATPARTTFQFPPIVLRNYRINKFYPPANRLKSLAK